jgi:hypothetical protein
MTRSVQVPLFVLAAALAMPALAAAEESSAIVKAMLAELAPRYTPPPAKATVSPAVEEPHETEKPRNGIIRLPRYLVQETKPPTFKERELLTQRGALDLAYKRHPGLRLGSFGPFKNDVWAKALLDEEWGIERSKEMFELLRFAGANPPPEFLGRPAWGLPFAGSGPWAGLVVPWERR